MENADILTLAALVAAFVGVAKLFKSLPSKYYSLIALGVAAVFVLVPDFVREKIIMISIIGLTASGTYQYSKNKAVDMPKGDGSNEPK